jgi:hypothetical protein
VPSVANDRFSRHQDRLATAYLQYERLTSWLATIFAALAGLALILLSVFDVRTHISAILENILNCVRHFITQYIGGLRLC